jgi:hypothetical protein
MELEWKYLDELYREKYFDKVVPPVYLKSEADKVIAYQKYRRCLAMADYAMYHHFRMLEIHGHSLDNNRAVFKINYGLRWRCRWLELAEKFKEAK